MEREELAAELASRRWQELLALLYAARCLRPAGYHPSAQDSADYPSSAQESADYYPCALADACIAALRRALCVDNVLPLALGAHRCAAPTLLAEAFCLLRCHFHAPATVGAGLGLGLGPPPRYCAEGLQQGNLTPTLTPTLTLSQALTLTSLSCGGIAAGCGHG